MKQKREVSIAVGDVQKIPLSPFLKLIGVTVEQQPPDPPRLILDCREELGNTMGTLNGGVIASLVDSAIGFHLLEKREGRRAATIELKVNYFKPVRQGRIIAEGQVLHMSSTMAFGQATIYTGSGKLIAVGSATYRLLD